MRTDFVVQGMLCASNLATVMNVEISINQSLLCLVFNAIQHTASGAVIPLPHHLWQFLA